MLAVVVHSAAGLSGGDEGIHPVVVIEYDQQQVTTQPAVGSSPAWNTRFTCVAPPALGLPPPVSPQSPASIPSKGSPSRLTVDS